MSHSHSHAHDHGHSHDHSHSHSHDHAPPPPYPHTSTTNQQFDDDNDAREQAHHQATVVATFDTYRLAALHANQRRRSDYYRLPAAHRALLPDYPALLNEVDEKLEVNAEFVRKVIEQNPFPPPEDAALDAKAPGEGDHERLRSTLRQCVRDWSEAGKHERDTTYKPILAALEKAFPNLSPTERAQTKVLVPGAGLGRLAWEVVRAGFSCQANEFSLHMLITSSYLLNHTSVPNSIPLHPYIHTFSNTRTKADLLEPVYVPDVNPEEISGSSWDSCITCFFLDTAQNIVAYLLTIYKLLKPGGYFVNLGPLLWHFENDREGTSIELTLGEAKALARRIGFEIEDEREIVTNYTTNPKSLLRHEYTAAFWTARKKA